MGPGRCVLIVGVQKRRKIMVKKICCEHYAGDGYLYELENAELSLCENCNKELFKQMVDQYKLEKKTQ